MTSVLVSSCSDCKTKCCKFGPGPYKTLHPHDFLDGYGTSDNYNTRCSQLSRSSKCKLWGTIDLPMECRTFVCQNKKFSKAEIKRIDSIVDCDDYGQKCPSCKAMWYIAHTETDFECELCGHKWGVQLYHIPATLVRIRGVARRRLQSRPTTNRRTTNKRGKKE